MSTCKHNHSGPTPCHQCRDEAMQRRNSLAPVIGSETPWETTQRLLAEAVVAVNALAEHLKQVPDKPRMYKANRALHELWGIE